MYPINDREYLKICANIASEMSISLSAAKKKVEIQISRHNSKTIEEKRKIASDVLDLCKKEIGKISDKPIIIVCQNGNYSARMAADLKKENIRVFIMKGGINSWRNENLPLIS